jgi:hypothetical protein
MKIAEGIEGTVYHVSGNQMPSPDIPRTPARAIKTTVYVYELTNISKVTRANEGSFYTAINSKLVKQFESDKKGHFKIALPPGKYSIFTKKDTLFYANRFDGQGNIAPVEVLPGTITTHDVRIDYDAVY